MSAKRVELHRGAREDYLKTVSWYLDHSVILAERFQDEFATTLVWLVDNAELPTPDAHGIRWKRMDRFPHLIYYRMKDSETMEVLAVAHGRQRPGYWKSRVD